MSESVTRQYFRQLPNGLTLVGEAIPNVRSAALTLLVRAGAATDPENGSGAATVLADWLLRGAGQRDSRGLSAYLDNLGVQRSSQAETIFMRFSASMLGKNLLAVLPVYADILQRPHLTDAAFAPARDLALQQLEAIEDEPSHKLGLLLRERHYEYPLGRPSVGTRQHLEQLTPAAGRTDFAQRFTPQGAILAVAGMFDWPALAAAVEEHFGSWPGKPAATLATRPAARAALHVTQETNQVQIGLAYDAPPDESPEGILVQTAVMVLSGGMGARLFTEIREKQGLCYSVHAGYHSFQERAAVLGYSGTAPERAQRTLDSFVRELARMQQGVTDEELSRAKIGMKARVIMQGESTGARAATLAYDFYQRGRTRTLEEVRALIDGVSLEKLNVFLAAHPTEDLTVVTIGPAALTIPA